MKNYSIYVNLNSGKKFLPADWQLVASAQANSKEEAMDLTRKAAFAGERMPESEAVTLYVPQFIPVSKRGRTMKAEID